MASSNHTSIPQGFKRCSRGDKCVHPDGCVLPFAEFGKYSASKDGLRGHCKICANTDRRKPHQRASAAAYQRKYRKTPQNRAWQKQYRQTEKHKAKEARREKSETRYLWRLKRGRSDSFKTYQYRWRKTESGARSFKTSVKRYFQTEHGKLKRKQYTHQRRALERQASGQFTASDVKLQYKSQKGKCWWCGKFLKNGYHIDHLTPLSRGGTNDARNIVLTCPHCNLSKNNKMPHEWSDRLL